MVSRGSRGLPGGAVSTPVRMPTMTASPTRQTMSQTRPTSRMSSPVPVTGSVSCTSSERRMKSRYPAVSALLLPVLPPVPPEPPLPLPPLPPLAPLALTLGAMWSPRLTLVPAADALSLKLLLPPKTLPPLWLGPCPCPWLPAPAASPVAPLPIPPPSPCPCT